ncbi:hypothetical protein OWV82_018067 [Melia azedarach]|uniref:Uncharacterized protein n=1 Tax=Melia azedarach TaxID=155640 RepID=A0ACC1X9L8_MELAZ|nr:hypothetical protein OWV82_018067 [Melia azedarach]
MNMMSHPPPTADASELFTTAGGKFGMMKLLLMVEASNKLEKAAKNREPTDQLIRCCPNDFIALWTFPQLYNPVEISLLAVRDYRVVL